MINPLIEIILPNSFTIDLKFSKSVNSFDFSREKLHERFSASALYTSNNVEKNVD